ncbi:MAG: carboxypeptidase regulatory-like domain-containing protein, partial [Acidobacteria bacterium]|nr:carboxypeptidase regulatory-like domain-containing protein [Acidobacteriota bacterium]
MAVPAWTQATGSLTGTVTDPTEAVVPGAKVTLTHSDTGVVREATTGSAGIYTFPQLPPGVYRLEVAKEGFRTAVRPRVVVQVASAITLNVEMEIGAVAETVEVEAGAAVLNTQDASIGTAFTGIQVQNLPMEARDPAGLLSLQAGVTFVPGAFAGDARGGSAFDSRSGSVFGSRSDQSNVTLDGIDVNDPQYNFAFNSALRMTLDSLAEFRVTTTSYNADLGRSSAAQVSLVTKSGTNTPHGSAYWYHRNEATAANEWFLNAAGVPKRKLRKHIFGASLGGPIVKDRFFLFGNWEDLRRSTEESVVRQIPSWAFRHGYLTYQCANPADPGCGGGPVTIAGQTVTVPGGFHLLTSAEMTSLDLRPWSTDPYCDPLTSGAGCGVNQFAVNYFQQFPLPNDSTIGDGYNFLGYRFAAPIKDTLRAYVLRADYNLTPTGSHTLFFRGNLQDDTEASTPQFPGLPPSTLTLTNNKGFAVGYKAILSPTVVNSFRYGLTRIKEENAGLQDQDFFDFRFIDEIQNFDSNTYGRTIPAHAFKNDLTWTRGTHTFSYGADLRYTRNSRYNNGGNFHAFSSNPSWFLGVGGRITPGEARCVATAANGYPVGWQGCETLPAVSSAFRSNFHDAAENLLAMYSQVNSVYNYDREGNILPHAEAIRRKFGADEYEFYFQDSWRASPALTFTYGVRYGVYSPPWEVNGNQVAPTISLGELFETRSRGMRIGIPDNAYPRFGFDLSGPANDRPGYYAWDWNNWSPRVAVAWAPRYGEGVLGKLFGDGKLALRGGYSIVYDRIGHGLATSFDEAGSFGMATSIATPYGTTLEETAVRFTGTFDIPFAAVLFPAPPGGFPQDPPAEWNTIDWGLDDTIVTPYSHTLNFSVAREFPADFLVEVGYVGRRGRHLLTQRDLFMPLDLCDPISGTCYFEAAQQLIRMGEQGVDILSLGPIPYWENMFPSFGPTGANAGFLGCDIWGVDPAWTGGFSATQVAYDWWMCMEPDYTYAPYLIDLYGYPGVDPDWSTGVPSFAVGGPYSFFNDVYNALAAWSSVGRS